MTKKSIIETPRLTLRKPNAGDTDACVSFMMSDRAQYVGGPLNHGRAWRSFASIIGHWDLRGFGMFAIILKGTDQAIGMTGPYFPGDYKEVELGWSIWTPEYEGQGLASEAALAARNYAYDALNLTTLVSFIAAENARSIALAKRLGAEEDATAFDPYADEVGEGVIYRHPSHQTLGNDGNVEAYA